MNDTVRWGILGTGRIARAFAEGLRHVSNGKLEAIASRTMESARRFGDEWERPVAFESYQALAESDEVDAVYVATPHTGHAEYSILCLKNGKAVLCEKPFAVNASQVAAMIEQARQSKILLMEGMWSRPPLMDEIRSLLASGRLGEIRTLQADFGFKPASRDPDGRLLNPDLAGGSMLDVRHLPHFPFLHGHGMSGILCFRMEQGATGVDEQASHVFKYANGSMALLHSSLESETGQEAFISGTEGNLRIHKQCWKPQKMTIFHPQSGVSESVEMPFEGNGFNYEAESFGNLLLKGELESPIMPLEESLRIMRLMDEIRSAWGLRYPMED